MTLAPRSTSAARVLPLDTVFAAETPEGITLAQRPAGVVSRTLAFGVDFGVRIAVMIAASAALSRLQGVGGALWFILIFLLEWFYPVVFELLPGSATPGKRMVGLKVVMDSGLPVTPAASLIRNLLRTADFLPAAYGFGLVAMMSRADSKRIGDLAAGTLVVHVERVALHGALPPSPARAPSRPLGLDEQAAVIAWAGRASRLTPERMEELARLASPALSSAMPVSPALAISPALHDGREFTTELLAVAHWLLGERPAADTRPNAPDSP